MGKVKVGDRFTRLTVVKDKLPEYKVICVCDCGKVTSVCASNLLRGATKSCGCLRRESIHIKHGGKGTRLYRIWQAMKGRCNRETDKSYIYYGAKGIKVCDEWKDFSNFRDWSLDHGYTDNLTIDRIDPNGNYEPTNCRWATEKQQQNNKTSNHFLTLNNETKTISEWSDETGINQITILMRIRRGWTVEDSLTKPVRRRDCHGDHGNQEHRESELRSVRV